MSVECPIDLSEDSDISEEEIEKCVVDILEKNRDETMGVTELTANVIDDPEWEDRELIQSALGDLLHEGKIAQTPEWEYTIRK